MTRPTAANKHRAMVWWNSLTPSLQKSVAKLNHFNNPEMPNSYTNDEIYRAWSRAPNKEPLRRN